MYIPCQFPIPLQSADRKEEEIRLLLQKQVSKASIAKIVGVTPPHPSPLYQDKAVTPTSLKEFLLLLRTAAAFMRAASSSNNAVLFELPVSPALSFAVRALSPARTRRFDSCQVRLGTRSAIFAVGQHFVQEAPFAIPHSAKRGCSANWRTH